MAPCVPHLVTKPGNAGAEQVLWTRGFWPTDPTCTDMVKMPQQGPVEEEFQIALLRTETTNPKRFDKDYCFRLFYFLKQVIKYLIETVQRNKQLDLCKEADTSARSCSGAG